MFSFSIQVKEVKLQLYFNGPRAAENRLMYLVSATRGSYNSTDYLNFVAKEKQTTKNEMKKKKENVHDMKLNMYKSLWFKCKERNHMSISFEPSSALDIF